MFTREEDVEVHALHQRGWTIAAIARHVGRDRKTVRDYLSGKRTPGVRVRSAPDRFDPFADYVTARLAEDPHLWAQTLHDELVELGFALSYQSLTRNIRNRDLRPACDACRGVTERPNAVIDHVPGDETQWDWLELPNPPASWGWGKTAHLLVGSLAYSGKWRAVLSASEDQPHLIAGLDRVIRSLGGVSRVWRFDRMATVCDPGSGRLSASFAGVAKHYGVSVAICPPRRGNRKGVVEKINHTAAQRWWRTLADEMTVEAAQASIDKFATVRGDTRLRATADGRSSVAVAAQAEPLRPPPAVPYPVIVAEARTASRQALVSYRGNRYSVPPELAGTQVTVSCPVGGEFIDIATAGGVVVARHRLAADGLGVMVRDGGHVIALQAAAMTTATSGRPHRRKERIPPGDAAKAAAARLRQHHGDSPYRIESSTAASEANVIDMSAYERAAQNRTIK
ncbi:DDE-type integrase/transposase/recombinase [Mycobacterium sp. UM_WGJ]|uniref:Mu transposase domain-containing protein n=1 Tax=Mycobacterium sp. UM_WGJ TaxID=1370120 RepID=UPI000465719A|nr:DDE-type integrase/transposase/recombinase [Mycobacterium sp. UM_WGJ]